MQDHDVIDALRADLAELTALHAPSGSEQPVIARLRDLFMPLVEVVAVDHMGNLTATREGPQGAPHIVVSTYADEIGAMVAYIEPEGFLRLSPIGGVQSRLLEGRAVWVGGQPGVIGARSGHLTPASTYGQGVSMEELYVDLGVDDAAGVEALGVRLGDPVVVLNMHHPEMSHSVTLSAAKGLSRWAWRCFAALSMTALSRMLLPPGVTLSRSEGSVWVLPYVLTDCVAVDDFLTSLLTA